jgi:hypothetical protein
MKNLIDYIQEGLKITADTEIEDLYDTPGVYAYFNDGYMTDNEGYIEKHKKDAIGVAVIAEVDGELHRIVIDRTDVNWDHIYYGGFRKKIDGATIATDEATALKDMNGKANTIAISDACHGYTDNWRTGSAAEDCRARFNGKGYLPALGELKIIYNRKDDINKMIELIGGTALKESWYWSSTLYDISTRSWGFYWYDGKTTYLYRNSTYVRAVMEI